MNRMCGRYIGEHVLSNSFQEAAQSQNQAQKILMEFIMGSYRWFSELRDEGRGKYVL